MLCFSGAGTFGALGIQLRLLPARHDEAQICCRTAAKLPGGTNTTKQHLPEGVEVALIVDQLALLCEVYDVLGQIVQTHSSLVQMA